MTYRDYEDSPAAGMPVELYDIFDEDGNHWRLNTSNEIISYGGFSYYPEVVSRSEIMIGGTSERNTVEVKLPRNYAFSNQFISGPIDFPVALIIYRQHVDQYATFWRGNLVAVKFDKNTLPTCIFEPATSSGPRLGIRRRCQLWCDHVLYDSLCQLSMSTYESVGVIDGSADNGLTITSTLFSAQADGYYKGGLVKVGGVYRFVLSHVTDTITIDRALPDVSIGTTIYAYAGCDLTPDTCRDKFSNILNFGGQEFLPVDDLYTSGTDSVSQAGSARSEWRWGLAEQGLL